MNVVKKLIQECDDFKKEQLKNTKEQIYNNFYEIRFYEEIKRFFSSYYLNREHIPNKFEELCLAIDGKNMYELYEEFKDSEYASLDNWEQIKEFLGMEL